MNALIASDVLVDLVLATLAIELLAVALAARFGPARLHALRLAPSLAAGCCLVLAFRAILIEAWWGWAVLGFTAALAAHCVDVAQRWRAGARESAASASQECPSQAYKLSKERPEISSLRALGRGARR